MKFRIKLFLFSAGLFFSNNFSQGPRNAIGFAVHNGPALITSKIWVAESYAIDVTGTFNFQDTDNWVYIHSDFLLHNFSTIRLEEGLMPLYWGGGIKLIFGDITSMGIRAPMGASYIHKNSLFETFFEIAPFLDIVTDLRFSLDGAIGFRLYL